MNNEHGFSRTDSQYSRRKFIAGAAGLLPVVLAGKALAADDSSKRKKNADTLPPPRYTLAVHMNANFVRQAKDVPLDERFNLAASLGAKAYQIGGFSNLDLDEYRRNADKHGMRCASLAGTGQVGLTTGLTVTGKEKEYLDFFTTAVEAAKDLGAQNLVSFVGLRSDTIPWATQYKQIISGLRKAGDIAGEAGVYLTLEPLNQYWKPTITVQSAQEGFEIIREVNHPHVKLDFDIHHLQQSEGNLTRNLREGMAEGLIQFVEVGGVPGRMEPGTGEVNYQHIFNELRRLKYDGFIGMEHYSKTSFTSAFKQVKRLAGVE
ncbi:TIM barrel protein [Pelagicoccus mobilis]|uniref:TIM barrel protein n=1 Tax=Pelagicoccus mobilis TaxID=415221 RepID=A0A934RW45_9BACT|nr:TIM barrel protein [Pelagicoccus mobilis]MBK1877453.1 TIM barrel protein [Pelagicoccus mobilis]